MSSGLLKSIERTGRKRLNGLFRKLLVRPGEPSGHEPKRILVLRIDDRIGNLVLLTSFLNALEERFPDAETTLLVSSRFADVIRGRGWKLIVMGKKEQISNPFLLRKLLKRIASKGFDTVVDASHPHGFSLSTAMLAAMTGAPRRIGSPAPGGEGWYTSVPSAGSWPGKGVHESMALHALGSVWEGWPGWRPPSLTVTAVKKDGTVGFHAGGKPGRAFSAARLGKLCSLVGERAPVRIYWGSDEERERAEIAAAGPVQVADRIPLARLPEELASLAHFVTPDTGPMHLASAVGTSVTAVFAVDNIERFKPLSPGSRAMFEPTDGDVLSSVLRVLPAFR